MNQMRRRGNFLCALMFAFTLLVGMNMISPSAHAEESKVDINTATKKELKQIVGIGEVISESIIEMRPYASIDDLLKVSGIGEVKLQKIKDQGIAYVKPLIPFQVEPLYDNQTLLKGNASPGSQLQIYINDVLFQKTAADVNGEFSTEIGYVDIGNTIKVEQYSADVLQKSESFPVKESGKIVYNGVLWDQLRIVLNEGTPFYSGKIDTRYRGLVSKININISTPGGVVMDQLVTINNDDSFYQDVPTIFGASISTGMGQAKLTMVSNDSRKFRYTHTGSNILPMDIYYTTVQDLTIQEGYGGQFYFTGSATPGVHVKLYVGSKNIMSRASIEATSKSSILPSFPAINSFATSPIGNTDQFLWASKKPANIPVKVYTSYRLDDGLSSKGTSVVNPNIDAPPAQLFAGVPENMYDDYRSLKGLTIPNSKVKIRMYDEVSEAMETKIIDVDDTGGFSYGDFGNRQFRHSTDTIYVTTIVNGIEGKENELRSRYVLGNPWDIFFTQVN